MKRIDIFEKLKGQEEEAFSRLSHQERKVIQQYQQKRKASDLNHSLLVRNIKKQPPQRPITVQISSPTRNNDHDESRNNSSDRIYNKISENHKNIQLKHCPSSKQRLSSQNIYCRPSKRETRVSILQNPNITSHHHQTRNEARSINFQRNRSYDLNADIEIYNKSIARQNDSFERKSVAPPDRILHPHVMDTGQMKDILNQKQRNDINQIRSNIREERPQKNRLIVQQPEPNRQNIRNIDDAFNTFAPISRKVNEKKRVKISESAFSKAKEYGRKVNINLSNNSINSSIQKKSTAANSRHQASNSSFKKKRNSSKGDLRIQTLPQSRTNAYYQSKRDLISNRFIEEQRQIRAARKHGLINPAPRPQFLEGAKYTRPSSEAGSRSHSIHNSVKQSNEKRGISYEYSNYPRQNDFSREKSMQKKYSSPLRVKNETISHFNPTPSQNHSSIGSRASYIRSQSTVPCNKQAKIVGRKISTNMNSQIVSSSLAKRYNIPNSHFMSQDPANAHSYSYMKPTSSSQACQSENITNQISLKSQARSNIAKRIGDNRHKVRGTTTAEVQVEKSISQKPQQNYSTYQNRRSIINSQLNNDNTKAQKQKLQKKKTELYNIINRLSSHLKICNNFAKELEKIEF